jgi:GTP pyrophosphokinase
LYEAVGVGEVTPGQVARALHEIEQPKPTKTLPNAETTRPRKKLRDNIVIEGVGNLLTQLARCCQPLPGDAIVGYLTRGKGVSIHRSGCVSLAALVARDPDRVIEVQWGTHDAGSYEVRVHVRAYDRKGLLKDVSGAIANANIPVVAASTRVDPVHGMSEMFFVLRVADYAQLSVLLGRIRALPNVTEARREAG